MEDLARWSDFDTNLFKSRGGKRELLVPSRLLFYANLISNLQRRYLREIISKVCFFRGIYFPFSLSPLPSWNSSPPVNSFSSSSSFLWSLNAARLNIPYFHSFVRWKCAFLAREEAIIIRCLQFYNKQERREGRIYLRF